MSRRFLSALMSMLLIFALPFSAFAASLGDYPDAPTTGEWSHSALDYAVQNDLLRGINGKIEGQGPLTRAQMATVINRAYGTTAMADISHFHDVSRDDWFYNDLAKAYQMGSLNGRSATQMAPNADITRQEVFAIFARLLSLPAGPGSALAAFSDGGAVADWAKGSVAALVEVGIVGGANGKLNPTNTITRAEYSALMQKTFPNIIRSADQLANLTSGNVLIAGEISEVKDLAVQGDLILGDGVDNQSIILTGKVDGRLVSRGGKIIDVKDLAVDKIIVNNPNCTTTLKVDKLKELDAKTAVEVVEGVVEKATGNAVAREDGKILSQDKDSASEKDDSSDKVTEEDKDKEKDQEENKDQDSVYYKPESSSSSHHSTTESEDNDEPTPTPKPEPGDNNEPTPEPGDKVLYGESNVDQQRYPSVYPFVRVPYYNARVKVELNDDGTIKSVSDNETASKGWDPASTQENWERSHSRFWNHVAEGDIWTKFVGKNRDEVAALEVSEEKYKDHPLGANAEAIKQAVLNALDKKPGKTFLKPEQTLYIGDVNDADAGPRLATAVADGFEATFNNTLPEDFDVQLHSVYQSVFNAVEENKLEDSQYEFKDNGDKSFTFKLKDKNAKPGKYYVNIVDGKGKYRSPDFYEEPMIHYPHFIINKGDSIEFDEAAEKMIVSDGDAVNFNKNIKEIVITEVDANGDPVQVKDREGNLVDKKVELSPISYYGTQTRYNRSPMFNEKGEINKEMTSGCCCHPSRMFEPGKQYRIHVSAYGYGETEFSFGLPGRTVTSNANVDQRHYPKLTIDNFVHPPFYSMHMKVYMDEAGKVTEVTEYGTTRNGLAPNADFKKWKKKNAEYFLKVLDDEEFMNRFVGMDAAAARSLMERIDADGTDAVSGATDTSGAVAEAVYRALSAPAGVDHVDGRKFLEAPMVLEKLSDTEYSFANSMPEGFESNNDNVSVYHGIYNGEGEAIGSSWNQDEKKLTLDGKLNAPGLYMVNIRDISQDGLGTWRSPDFEKNKETGEVNFPHIVVPFGDQFAFEAGILKNTSNNEAASALELAAINQNIKEIMVKEKGQEEGVKVEPIGHHGYADPFYRASGPFFIEDGEKTGSINTGLKARIHKEETAVFADGKTYDIAINVWGMDEPITFEYTVGDGVAPEPNPEPIPNPDPTPDPNTETWYEGVAGIVEYDSDISIRILLDEDQRIKKIEDNGTTPAADDRAYWTYFLQNDGLEMFLNKNKTDVENMQMGEVYTPGPDAVTGATATSKAVRNAVLNAFSKIQ